MNDIIANDQLYNEDHMLKLTNSMSSFDKVSLKGLNSIDLMTRYDTKYVFHMDKLSSIFQALNQNYEILEIDKKRSFKYESLYFDTDDYFFYHQHHNERSNRYKVRNRIYRDSSKCYFEVKYRNNKNKTFKNRYLLNDRCFEEVLSAESITFAKNHLLGNDRIIIDKISPKLRVDYNRITLVNRQQKERLTFDINLTYIGNDFTVNRLNNVVIAEIKQENVSMNSQSILCFREFRILPTSFSKYCMGVALTEENIKKNRFKKKLLTLEKMR